MAIKAIAVLEQLFYNINAVLNRIEMKLRRPQNMTPGQEAQATPIPIEKIISDEIIRVVERNQNELFLRKLLTRALILEKLLR